MGCCNEVMNSHKTKAEMLESFKINIGLNKFSSLFMDRLFYKYSTNRMTSMAQFSMIEKELGINTTHYKNFFEQFIHILDYDTTKLSTLGVLIGKESKEKKIKILFDNYDSNLNKMLKSSEAMKMFTDIIKISCIFIPKYCHETYPERNDIKDYYICLRNMSRGMINHLQAGLMNKNQNIDFEEFKRAFEGEIYSNLLDDAKARTLCFKHYLCIADATKNVMKTLKDPKLKAEVREKIKLLKHN